MTCSIGMCGGVISSSVIMCIFSPQKIERIMSWAIQIQIVEAVDGKPKDEDPEGVLLVAVQHLCRALISSAADQRSWIL